MNSKEALKELKYYNTLENGQFDMTKELSIIETSLDRLEKLKAMCDRLAKLVVLDEKDYIELERRIEADLDRTERVEQEKQSFDRLEELEQENKALKEELDYWKGTAYHEIEILRIIRNKYNTLYLVVNCKDYKEYEKICREENFKTQFIFNESEFDLLKEWFE